MATLITVRKDFNSSSEYSFCTHNEDGTISYIGGLYATRGLLNAGILVDGKRVKNIPQGEQMFLDAANFLAARNGINEFTFKTLI